MYLELFLSFLQIGLFSVGGGYAAIPLIQDQAVVKNSWLSMSEFTDLITIAEMTPGPIAINAATFIGNKVDGITGAIIATFGCIFPSLIVVSLLAYIYNKYKGLTYLDSILFTLRATVVALIAAAGISILQLVVGVEDVMKVRLEDINFIGIALFFVAIIALVKFKKNPILVMVVCGVINLATHLIINVVS